MKWWQWTLATVVATVVIVALLGAAFVAADGLSLLPSSSPPEVPVGDDGEDLANANYAANAAAQLGWHLIRWGVVILALTFVATAVASMLAFLTAGPPGAIVIQADGGPIAIDWAALATALGALVSKPAGFAVVLLLIGTILTLGGAATAADPAPLESPAASSEPEPTDGG